MGRGNLIQLRGSYSFFVRLVFCCLLPFGFPLAQQLSGLTSSSDDFRRKVLYRVHITRDPAAGPAIVEHLLREQVTDIRDYALRVLGDIYPLDCLPRLRRVAALVRDQRLARGLTKLIAKLERVRPLILPGPRKTAAPSPAKRREILQSGLGPTRLVVRVLDGLNKPLTGALVRVWSSYAAVWLPLSASRKRKFVYAKTDDKGAAVLVVPTGPLVVAAWSPTSFTWRRLGKRHPGLITLCPSARLQVMEPGRCRQTMSVEAWPAGPWPRAGFPSWKIRRQQGLTLGVTKGAPLDMLVQSRPLTPDGEAASRHAGLFVFLRAVNHETMQFPQFGMVALSGRTRRSVSYLRLRLSPHLRPDLARDISFPAAGGLLRLGRGKWRGALAWNMPRVGSITCYPRGFSLAPGGREEFSLSPMRASVYAKREARLGTARNVLTMTALFRTPDGSVLKRYAGRSHYARVAMRVTTANNRWTRLTPGLTTTLPGLAPADWSPGATTFQLLAPFMGRNPLTVRGQKSRFFASSHFKIEGPFHLRDKAQVILSMAESALRAAVRVTGRQPNWDQVPILAHNYLPPGVGASAAGSNRVAGRLNYRLRSLLAVALPADVLQLPWIHEMGHKLGYPHDLGMSIQTVETSFAMLGTEGVDCAGTFAGGEAFRLACGSPSQGKISPHLILALLRRIHGAKPMRRYLKEQERVHWLLEGQGFSEEVAGLAALSYYTGERIDGWFQALGLSLSRPAVGRACQILAQTSSFPDTLLSTAITAFDQALGKKQWANLPSLLQAIHCHRQRARAAVRALGTGGGKLPRQLLRFLVQQAQMAGALTSNEIWNKVRAKALTSWVRHGN